MGQDDLGTAAQIARALRMPPATVRRYACERAIHVASRDAHGRPLYRVADVAAERHRRRVATGAVVL